MSKINIVGARPVGWSESSSGKIFIVGARPFGFHIPSAGPTEYVYTGNIPLSLLSSSERILEAHYSGSLPVALSPSSVRILEAVYAGDILLSLTPSYVSILESLYAGAIDIVITPTGIYSFEESGVNEYIGNIPISLTPSYLSIMEMFYAGAVDIVITPTGAYIYVPEFQRIPNRDGRSGRKKMTQKNIIISHRDFLAAAVDVNAGVTKVNGTDFTSLELDVRPLCGYGTISVTFTRAAGLTDKIAFYFQVSNDEGLTWSTVEYVKIEYATNSEAVSNVVRGTEPVILDAITHIRLWKIVNNDASNNCTACNATLSL